MSNIKKGLKKIALFLRHKKYRKTELKQEDVTILSNCCIGGTMYNDLGLKFLSPTINLFFGHHSFIDLVNHLDEYKDGELINTGEYDINERGAHAPICLLCKQGLPNVEIHFLHYDTFEEAKEKWFLRFQRINHDKIFLVIEAKDEHEHELIDEYTELPYPKVIFTDLPSIPEKSVKHMSLYVKKNNKRSLTEFVNVFGARGYDEYDFANEIFNRDYR